MPAIHNHPSAGIARNGTPELLVALAKLDSLLQQAVAAVADALGAGTFADPFRGLSVPREEVARLFGCAPGEPAFLLQRETDTAQLNQHAAADARLTWLARRFDLSPFDLDVLLIALAPEIDLRYERLYAYLQDNVTQRRPSVNLALDLLCASAEAKLAKRWHLSSDAPLLRSGLVRLEADPHSSAGSSLARAIVADGQVVRFLLGLPGLDARLSGCCSIANGGAQPEAAGLDEQLQQGLVTLVEHARSMHQPLCLYFHGPSSAGCHQSASVLAEQLAVGLLRVDVAAALQSDPAFTWLLPLVTREAECQRAILFLDGWDTLASEECALPRRRMLEALRGHAEVVIVAGRSPWSSPELMVTQIPFARPNFAQRRAVWEQGVQHGGFALPPGCADDLAGRFKLSAAQIAAAAESAGKQARWRAAREGRPAQASAPTTDDLFAAARAQSGQALAALAQKVRPCAGWSDLVLPADVLAQLREIAARVALGQQIWHGMGFGRRLGRGRGVTALFAGAPGTGKTMAAEVVAGALRLDLYRIDLAGVVSKWIGETEKNLDRIFRAAEDANAVLLFDEADALFGKRSEVRDAHDRYANIETAYLLQKMEEYEGVALLATNLVGNMDDAFARRLTFTVPFPFPDEALRLRLWRSVWPAEVELAADVQLDDLAARFKLSGGHIRNIALAAAFLAAGDGGPIRQAHLLHATRREYQKLGKALSDAELSGAPGRARQ